MRCLLLLLVTSGVVLSGCGRDSSPVVERPADDAQRGPGPRRLDDVQPGPEGAAALPAEMGGGEVNFGKISLTAPEDWLRNPQSSSFVVAEFALPRAEGDDADGRLTLSLAGGSIEANIQRWRGQFGDKPQKESQETIDVEGLEIALVDFSGDFNDQRGPFAPAAPKSNYRMLAAIVPVDGQLHFVKAYGPVQTMASHAEKFQEFVRTTRKN